MAGGITAAVIGGAAVLGGAYMSSQASGKAAQAQSEAARYGADAQSQAAIYSAELQKEALDKQIALSEPFRTAGTSAVNQLSALYGQGGEMYNQQYTPEEFKYDQFTDPGTAFRLKEGMKAMNATAAARGGLISGNALRAGQAFGQELGSQEYQNAFNRYLSNNANKFAAYQANFANRLDPLKFLSGQGQAAAANQAANVGAGATNIGNTMVQSAAAQNAGITGAANAQAAGMIGGANAYTNAIGQGVSMYQTNQLLNRFAPQTTSYYGGQRTGGAAPVTDYSEIYSG
jgi:hypothetical protein